MKKLLMLLFVAVLCVGMLTACGAEPPTDNDIAKALQKEGFIDEDIDLDDVKITHEEVKEAEEGYCIYVEEVDMNDDKDRTKVECTLILTEGVVQTSLPLEIDFRVRDDDSWRCKEVERGEETVLLIGNIPDEDIEEQMDYTGVSVDDAYFSMYDENVTWKAKEHKLDGEGMTDTVTFECTGEYGYKKYDFTVEIEFEYYAGGNYWSYNSVEVVDSTVDFVDAYKDVPASDDVQAELEASDEYYYYRDYYYYSEGDIQNLQLGEISQDNRALYIPVTFTLADAGAMTLDLSATMYYYYDNEDGWEFQYITDEDLLDLTCDAVGTWVYKTEERVYTMVIKDEMRDDSDYMDVEITIEFLLDGTSCKYRAYLYEYEGEGGYMTVYSDSWIEQPTTSSYVYMESFSGMLEGGRFVSNSSWSTWAFDRQ